MLVMVATLSPQLSARAAQARTSVTTQLIAEVRAEQAANAATNSSAASQARLSKADRLQQGQEIFYTLRIRNPSNQSLDDVAVVQAVPNNTKVIAGSVTGAGARVQCSLDDAATFVDLTAPLTQPSAKTDRALLGCTHLRWQLSKPLPAKATLLARFRAEFQ